MDIVNIGKNIEHWIKDNDLPKTVSEFVNTVEEIFVNYEDVKKLLEILDTLVAKGNTVLVIEHNMDFIKSADYVIDIGPEGGVGGGRVVAHGTPEEVARSEKSHTGKYLKKSLRKR